MSIKELKRHASEVVWKYRNVINIEIENLDFQTGSLYENIMSTNHLELLNKMLKHSLTSIYPNITIALRIFHALPVTSSKCERSFSKTKMIKNYLCWQWVRIDLRIYILLQLSINLQKTIILMKWLTNLLLETRVKK